MRKPQNAWRLDLGAEVLDEGVRFRVWAPQCRHVEVLLEGNPSQAYFPLAPEVNGYFSAIVPHLKTGALYRSKIMGNSVFRMATSPHCDDVALWRW